MFSDRPGDRSPDQYCEKLSSILTVLLSGKLAPSAARGGPVVEARKSIVRGMSLFPNRTAITGFAHWTIGTLIDGSDTDNIAKGGRAGLVDKLIGRSVSGNVWSSAAIWTLTNNSALVRLLQHAIRMKFVAKRYLVEYRRIVRRRLAAGIISDAR